MEYAIEVLESDLNQCKYHLKTLKGWSGFKKLIPNQKNKIKQLEIAISKLKGE